MHIHSHFILVDQMQSCNYQACTVGTMNYLNSDLPVVCNCLLYLSFSPRGRDIGKPMDMFFTEWKQ